MLTYSPVYSFLLEHIIVDSRVAVLNNKEVTVCRMPKYLIMHQQCTVAYAFRIKSLKTN
jgi:hypothetical protein